MLEISLLGGFEARLATGEPLRLKGRKTQALVAYLAIHAGEPRSRDELIALLWGDRGEAQARSSLRQSLSELRRALGGADSAPLLAGRSAVALEAAGIQVDTLAFERLIDDGTPAALHQAAALYRGDLLDGIGVHDAGFETWLRDERQRLKDRACDGLVRLLEVQEGDQVIATAQRLLALDPLREAGHRALMGIYAGQGDRTSALKQYRTCREALAAELGVAPEAETETLAEQIRGGAAPSPGGACAPEAETLPLPDKPSIAVLPFTNLSGDPSHAHFADCITEDIITALSKVPKLFVVARSSTFTYKGRTVEVTRVGREQGVRYVLEGSVQRGADRVRITAQLIDAASGRHVWAERYDRVIDDVFALQDEITREVTLALQIKLTDGEHARIVARGTRNLEAWELVLQANELLQGHHRHDVIEGRRLAGEALRLDETYGSAHGLLGWAHWMDAYNGWSEAPERSLDRALDAAEQALALEPDNSETHALFAMIHFLRKQYDQALSQIETATRLGPNNSKVMALSAIAALWCDEPRKAENLLRQAMRLCPIYPAWYPGTLAEVYFVLKQSDQAIVACQRSLECDPDYLYALVSLTASYAEAGRLDEARATAEQVLRIEPTFSIGAYIETEPYRSDQVLTRITDGLRAAGLPA